LHFDKESLLLKKTEISMSDFLPGTDGLLKAIVTAPTTTHYEFAAHVKMGYEGFVEQELLQAFDRLPAYLGGITFISEDDKKERIRLCELWRESINNRQSMPVWL
jgi:hypothetical protein